MDDFSFLLDAPAEPVKRHQIAKLGSFHHGTYGDFSITEPEVRSWQANLSKLPGGRALIDLDHRSERAPRNSEAAGWINSIDIEGEKVMAEIDWTPVGEKAVTDKLYQFFSPVFGEWKDESGAAYKDTLMSAALTNKPALTGLPAISLASPERVEAALRPVILLDALEGEAQIESLDSRAPMELTAITKALSLEEDADEQKVLDAIQSLQDEATKPETEAEVKSLDEQAKAEGKVVLDAEAVNKLSLDAAAGREAMTQLNAERFEHAFQLACDEGQAVPAEKESQEHFYSLDAEATLKALSERQPIVNVKPRGKNVSTDDLDAPDGVHPQAFQLDQEVKALMAEKDMKPDEYTTALHQVEAKRLAA